MNDERAEPFLKPHQARLYDFAQALIDQGAARVVVPPQRPGQGHWFGGGNLVVDADGSLLLCGRYRNAGDSRTGLGAGERGLELAVFRSTDGGGRFEKIWGRSKAELGPDVLSIEGSALRRDGSGYELFVSVEKERSYPASVAEFQKPGTGVWSIDRLRAPTVDGLAEAVPEPVLASAYPEHLHVKDPFLHERGGRVVLGFCSHPFSWASSNTGWTVRRAGEDIFRRTRFGGFRRGMCWDVAITRLTSLVDVEVEWKGAAREVLLGFYCGGESMRDLDEHAAAVKRPRGWSCEELGGLCVGPRRRLKGLRRLSSLRPAFVSPHGTGCSRYVDVLRSEQGYFATWQRSQPDLSQPLVLHHLPRGAAAAMLGQV